ncbi:MAG: ribonuclease III [Candidatus Xenobia bacterium]
MDAFQEQMGVVFSDTDLLQQALTHESYSHEHGIDTSNERLEFLGDAVLGLIVGHYLFETFPDRQEGDLTRMKSQAVSSDFLAQRARDLGLGDFLILGKGEEASGGRNRSSVLADALEALIGAIYLDGGLAAARDFVLDLFRPSLGEVGQVGKDYKGELQERTQKHFRGLPHYTVVQEEGPPHNRSFQVQVSFGPTRLGHGSGSSKKQAEQEAAREALGRFDELLVDGAENDVQGKVDGAGGI